MKKTNSRDFAGWVMFLARKSVPAQRDDKWLRMTGVLQVGVTISKTHCTMVTGYNIIYVFVLTKY